MQNIHARIGTAQASQCPVPTDPIYTKHRQYFENLWKSIVTTVARQGKRQTLCVLSEYGFVQFLIGFNLPIDLADHGHT